MPKQTRCKTCKQRYEGALCPRCSASSGMYLPQPAVPAGTYDFEEGAVTKFTPTSSRSVFVAPINHVAVKPLDGREYPALVAVWDNEEDSVYDTKTTFDGPTLFVQVCTCGQECPIHDEQPVTITTTNVTPVTKGRPKRYETDAQRQAAYRSRQ